MTATPTPDDGAALATRINDYLGSGGLFNPELMEHAKVRDLLIEIRDYLTRSPAPVSGEAAKASVPNATVFACRHCGCDLDLPPLVGCAVCQPAARARILAWKEKAIHQHCAGAEGKNLTLPENASTDTPLPHGASHPETQ